MVQFCRSEGKSCGGCVQQSASSLGKLLVVSCHFVTAGIGVSGKTPRRDEGNEKLLGDDFGPSPSTSNFSMRDRTPLPSKSKAHSDTIARSDSTVTTVEAGRQAQGCVSECDSERVTTGTFGRNRTLSAVSEVHYSNFAFHDDALAEDNFAYAQQARKHGASKAHWKLRPLGDARMHEAKQDVNRLTSWLHRPGADPALRQELEKSLFGPYAIVYLQRDGLWKMMSERRTALQQPGLQGLKQKISFKSKFNSFKNSQNPAHVAFLQIPTFAGAHEGFAEIYDNVFETVLARKVRVVVSTKGEVCVEQPYAARTATALCRRRCPDLLRRGLSLRKPNRRRNPPHSAVVATSIKHSPAIQFEFSRRRLRYLSV